MHNGTMLTALRSIFLFLFNFHFTSKTIQPWSISRHRERDFPDFNSLLFDELHQTFLDFYRSVLFFIVFKSYEFHILTTELPRYLYALIERDKWKREFGGWYDGMEVFVTRPSIRKKKNADSMSRARGPRKLVDVIADVSEVNRGSQTRELYPS